MMLRGIVLVGVVLGIGGLVGLGQAGQAGSGQAGLGQAGQGQAATAGASTTTMAPAAAGEVSLAGVRELAARGRLDEALAGLESLAKVVPEEAGVERLRGVILYQKELLPEAGAAFARAVQQDGGDRESVQMLGITLYRLGRPGEAIPWLEMGRASAAGPVSDGAGQAGLGQAGLGQAGKVNADPQYVLGLCYADTKRYEDARRAFAGQFGFGAETAEAYLVTARLLLRREFVDEAARFARRAVELNGTLPLAHQLLGEVALAKADLPEAILELEAERKLNPLNGELYDRLGDAYVRAGQFEQAREALNKAVLLEPNATGPYILLGQALIRLGEPIEALHYLNRAVGMDAGNAVTHTYLGQAYRALGRMADANREYKLAVEIQHRNDPKAAGAK